MNGVQARPAATLLTERAHDFLAAGPADAVALVAHVCQLPGAPQRVAEQMAAALFAERDEFARDASGRWYLAPAPTAPVLDTPPRYAAFSPGAAAGWAPRPIVRGATADLLDTLTYAVVDVETTGSRALAGDRITEVAAVLVERGKVMDRFETLVNPERPIPPMITALTNITWSMVKDAPRFGDICGDLLRFVEGRVFVAHNATFDWRFVSSEVARATGRQLRGERLCTVRMARHLLPQLYSRRLDALSHFFGVENPARHRAGGDAIATAHVFLRLLDAARQRECESWSDLQRLLATRRRARRRRRRSGMPRPVDRDSAA